MLWLGLCLGLGLGCESATTPKIEEGQPQAGAGIRSTEAIQVEDATRAVSVEVISDRTVLRIGETAVTFRRHRGYQGFIRPKEGSLRFGALEARYDAERLFLRSRKGWANVNLDEELNLYADQDGNIGRSIFRP